MAIKVGDIYLSQQHVNKTLSLIGNSMLKKPYKDNWSRDNITYGYCYIMSEVLYHYAEGDVKAHCINLGKEGTHWFVTINNQIIDFTAAQFNGKIDYNKSIGKGLLKGGIPTSRGYISKRGYEFAKKLNVIGEKIA